MKKNEEKVTLLEYIFIIENDNLWSNIYEFEADLAKFFGEHGIEAKRTNTINGQQGRRILILEKKEEIEKLEMPQKKEPVKIPTKKELVDKVVKKK